MTRWFPWIGRRGQTPQSSISRDQRLAQLTAKADLIVDELDVVVQHMSDVLRRKNHDPRS
jgi:hypothetical protein